MGRRDGSREIFRLKDLTAAFVRSIGSLNLASALRPTRNSDDSVFFIRLLENPRAGQVGFFGIWLAPCARVRVAFPG
jgi:hypothetical protein